MTVSNTTHRTHDDTADGVAGRPPSTLDDVMIAMDVVDTLRHDQRLAERELNDDRRRADLIDRLREIYKSQGIDVSDRMLEDGVRALEEDRFTYTPPPADALSTRLARLYVSRWSWGKYALGLIAGIFGFLAVNYVVFERPRQIAAQQQQQDLRVALPEAFTSLTAAITSEAKVEAAASRAQQIATRGRNAAKSGDIATARAARQDLQDLLDTLRAQYDIRVVNRDGELSGLWRVPAANPDATNFYIVVEAIAPDGTRLERSILNEETGQRSTVTTWAQRVDRAVLMTVKADKDDDGIIQSAVVGQKAPGFLSPRWSIDVKEGAITTW